MYDSIRNVGDFLSGHWLSEAFPGKLKTLTKEWRERVEHGKHSPLRGLSGVSGEFQKAKAALPQPHEDGYTAAVTELHSMLLRALGYEPDLVELDTEQSETPVTVPLLARCQSTAGEALHVLQARPVDDADHLLFVFHLPAPDTFAHWDLFIHHFHPRNFLLHQCRLRMRHPHRRRPHKRHLHKCPTRIHLLPSAYPCSLPEVLRIRLPESHS